MFYYDLKGLYVEFTNICYDSDTRNKSKKLETRLEVGKGLLC